MSFRSYPCGTAAPEIANYLQDQLETARTQIDVLLDTRTLARYHPLPFREGEHLIFVEALRRLHAGQRVGDALHRPIAHGHYCRLPARDESHTAPMLVRRDAAGVTPNSTKCD